MDYRIKIVLMRLGWNLYPDGNGILHWFKYEVGNYNSICLGYEDDDTWERDLKYATETVQEALGT